MHLLALEDDEACFRVFHMSKQAHGRYSGRALHLIREANYRWRATEAVAVDGRCCPTKPRGLVSSLELAVAWWLWTGEPPTREAILERAEWQGYGEAVRGLVSALATSDTELVGALARLAVAAAVDGTDAGVLALLNEACNTDGSLDDWLTVLPLA